MTKLFETLREDVQEELIRDHEIELVTVSVEAEPNPDQPHNRLLTNIAVELRDSFQNGIKTVEAGRSRIIRIIDIAKGDLSAATWDAMVAALTLRRDEMDELRESRVRGHRAQALQNLSFAKIFTPEFFAGHTKVTIWSHSWTAGMDDSGLMCLDCDEPWFADGVDAVSRARIRERVWRVNAEIDQMVRPLMMGR